MGIGNADGSPTSAGPQPRLLLWLDGSSAFPYVNNGLLDVWYDKSGNNHHFYPTGTYRPTVRIGGTFGGPMGTFSGAPVTPCVRFLDRDDQLVCPNFELPSDGYSIYFVIKTADDNYGLFSYATPTSDREVLIYNDNGLRHQMINSLDRSSAIGDMSNDVWNYGGITWSNSDEFNWEYNRTTTSESGFNTFNGISISNTGSIMIGDIQNSAGVYPTSDTFEGSIAEVIIYEGRLPRPATRLLRTYLWVKYGLNGAAGGWDKYHGNMDVSAGNQWGGKYYAPIGIGNDVVTPNAGSINEARSAGLVLRVNNSEWTQTRSYLCAAPVGNALTGLAPNTISSANLGGTPTVLERWTRLWEIAGNSEGNNQIFQIAFDFGEGIDGDIPQNPENFVLLFRNSATTGNFSILPIPNSDKFVLDDQLVFRVPKSAVITPGLFYTIGTTSASSSLTGDIKRTWYAYQSGNWSDPLTWTLDGSAAPAYVNPDGDTPGIFDDIFIGSGRTVTVDMTLPDYGDLKVFGTLNIGAAAQPSFLNISGSGLIRCASGNFPTGNSSAFADAVTGGTLEYYGTGNFTQSTNLEVNKLKINLSTTAATITLAANLITNGLFEVIRGTLVVNNTTNTSRTLESYDRVLIESQGVVKVSNAPPRTTHRWNFYSDLINNGGQVLFTNRTAANENFTSYNTDETNDIIIASFISNNSNQRLQANGISYFSKIVVDKGVDITYILSISSTNPTFFKLLGPCRTNMSEAEYSPEIPFTGNAGNPNSFALINGTAEIRENIFIPLHINVGNYNINYTAQLWINGGEVTKGRLGGTGNSAAIVNYGLIKVSSGVLNAFCQSGITIRGNGVTQVDGGTVNANQIRTSLLGPSNIGGLVINSGVVNLNGNRPEGSQDSYYTLSLTYPGNLFRMTGGTLNITGPTNSGLVFINSDPQNTSVSGGTVNLDVSDTQNSYKISSRAAFWDLTLTRSNTSTPRNFRFIDGTSGPDTNSAYIGVEDLIVRNNLTITGPNSPKLEMGTASAPSDLYLYGNLNIGNGGVYIHNNNTTHFVGGANSSLTFGGSVSFPFYNVEVNKDLESRFVNIQQAGPQIAMNILGSIALEKGYFINNDRDVEVRGNITNRTQFGNETSTGFIRMIGTSGQQELISDGGIFHDIRINNPDGVVLKNDGVTIKRQLTLEEGSFYIGDYKLRLETTIGTPIANSNGTTRIIVCSGNASAGGVEILNHTSPQTLFYPFGVSTGVGQKYTFAQIFINSGWVDDGYIRVTPVDTLLSTADLAGSPDYLNYYWKVTSSEYETKPNVTHQFRYVETDVRGTEANFESGRVLSILPFTRSIDNAPASAHVNTGTNTIYYNGPDQAQATSFGTGTPLVDADYSAGAADRFPIGTSPDIFYSRSETVGATWNTPGNWNKLSDCVGCTDIFDYHSTSAPASTLEFPQSGDIAIIGFNVNSGGKPHVYRAPAGGIEAAKILFTPLQDISGNRQPRYNGSTIADLGILRPSLEIANTSEIIKVGQISGEGALILKANINLGVTDIGGFLSEDSSIVVINNNSITPLDMNFLPAVVPNLFLGRTAPVITSDIRVRGNLEVAGQSRLTLSESINGNIEIDGDLILDKYQLTSGISPRVLFNKRGKPKTIEVHGNVKLLGTVAHIGINSTGGPEEPPVPWTPEEIGAHLWLDATVGVTTSGGEVTAWQDQATGTYIASQSDSGKRPLYQIGINGLNTIRFDGVDDFLAIPHTNALNLLANQDFEIFSVSQVNNPNAPAPNFPVIYGKGQTSPRDFLLYVPNGNYRLYMDANQLGPSVPGQLGTAANLGWARRQGSNAYIYNTIGGSNSAGGTANATNLGNTHNVTIGAAEDGNTRFLDGDIAEIILVKRSLTNEERQQLEGYLAHKWGIVADLPDGHPYKNEIPLIGGNQNTDAQLIVEGDIIQNLSSNSLTDNGVELFKTGTDTSSVNLIVSKQGVNEFINLGGPAPRLWKIKVDKGIDVNSSFSFNTDVNIEGPANELEKPVNIQNGLLKFNNSGINITLSSGGGDFIIPNSGGLELNSGNLEIVGNQTGMLLSGLLKITGGSLSLGDTEGLNNYIEYGGGSAPKIDISGGTLIVGSQIRRNLSNTGGALDYRQSGGNVVIGRYSAPATSRGMLEVVNAGSRFEHTGGTLTFVRGVTLGTTPSLLLTPTNYNISGTAEIVIGNPNSPSGAAIQNFGILSGIPLNALTINSNNSPVVNLITNNLELNGDLTIHLGATLNCLDRNLLLHKDVLNDGTLNSTSGLVEFIHPNSATVSGSGIFDLYNLERSGGSTGQTIVQKDLLVKNNFVCDNGEMDFEGNSLSVKGNVSLDGKLSFDLGSQGLIFDGNSAQILNRSVAGTSEIDILTINNEMGLTIPAGFFHFIINENLRLQDGVFSLTGNLLEMATGSVFTAVNSFSETNMIVTGGAFANFGIKVHVPANSTDDIFVPLGIDRFMPVNLDFSQPGYSSGTTASSYLLRLNLPENGVVIQDTEPVGNPQINDLNNVLGMYFSVDGSNIGDDLNMDLKLRYDDQYVQVTTPYTEEQYFAIRVLADNTTISKLGSGPVDEVNNIITFNLQGDFTGNEFAVDGDYFAGIDDAVPSTILEYETTMGFSHVDNGISGYIPSVPGGGAPSGALVTVKTGHALNFNIQGVNFYRTVIEEGATVIIDRTTQHRLGKVTGTGTILLRGSGNLPAGDYTEFFGCAGGKLQYQAATGESFEVLSNMPPIREVTLFGPGEIIIADNPVNICNNFIVNALPTIKAANSSLLTIGGNFNIINGSFDFRQGNTLVQGNLNISGNATGGGTILSGNNGVVTIEGNLVIGGRGISLGTVFRETHVEGNVSKITNPTGGSIKDGTGGAKLVLDGILPQTITGEFTGTSKIPGFELDNATGLTIAGNLEVSENLYLTDGNILTDESNIIRLTQDATQVDPVGGQPNSFVNGPMQWVLSNTPAEKKFPIGKNDRHRPLSVSNRSAARTWEAEYNDTIARVVPGIDPLMLPDPNNIPAIETVSIQEYWRVETNASPTQANIGLSWGDDSGVSTDEGEQSNLLVLAYDPVDNEWDSYGGVDFQYDSPTNRGTLNSAAPISFSERFITLGSSDGLVNPLPVTWLYFNGENKGEDNILAWATASEQDNDYFELERSFDASRWTVIAQVEGAGYSATTQTYTYKDENAPYGRVYYRLKQVDFDGAMEYAPNVVSLERGFSKESSVFDFLLYPNPTHLGTVQFRMSNVYDVSAQVTISDLSGKLISEEYVQIDGQGTSAPVQCNIEPGIYLVTVIVNNKMRSKPLVVTR